MENKVYIIYYWNYEKNDKWRISCVTHDKDEAIKIRDRMLKPKGYEVVITQQTEII